MHLVVVFHHARPEHADDFLAFMGRVTEAVQGAEGLLEFSSWREPGTSRLVAVSRWESAEAFEAALPRVRSLAPERREEWTDQPDEIVRADRV